LQEKEREHLRLVIVTCLVAVFVVYSIHPYVVNYDTYSKDFLFHYYKSSEKQDVIIKELGVANQVFSNENLVDYPPLVSWVFKPFSFNLSIFFLAVLMFSFVLFGLLLFFITKHWVSALFWVSTSASWFFLQGSIAQGVFSFLFVLFVFSNWKYRLVLLFIGLLTHNHGFYLMFFYWVFDYLWHINWGLVLPGFCGGGLVEYSGNEVVVNPVVSEKGVNLNSMVNVFGQKGLTYTSWLSVVRWFSFFPLFLFAFYGLWKENKEWFVFTVFLFVVCGLTLYWRAVESLVFFLVFGLTSYYKSSGRRMRWLLIVVSVLLFVLQIFRYLSLIENTHLSLSGGFFELPCWLFGF